MTDWNAIVEQYGGLVWATACRLVGNRADAADCFQETFLAAVKVSRKQTVRDWPILLRHLATARALDVLRARHRRQGRLDSLADPDATVSREAGPPLVAEAADLADRLRTALTQLPPEQAEVFCLSCLEDLSYREIGQRLKVSTNNVGVLLYRARGRLRELLIPVDAGSDSEG